MEERVRASLSAARLARIAQLGCPQLDAERFYAGLAGYDFLCSTVGTGGIIIAVSFIAGWVMQHRSGGETSTIITSSPSRRATIPSQTDTWRD